MAPNVNESFTTNFILHSPGSNQILVNLWDLTGSTSVFSGQPVNVGATVTKSVTLTRGHLYFLNTSGTQSSRVKSNSTLNFSYFQIAAPNNADAASYDIYFEFGTSETAYFGFDINNPVYVNFSINVPSNSYSYRIFYCNPDGTTYSSNTLTATNNVISFPINSDYLINLRIVSGSTYYVVTGATIAINHTYSTATSVTDTSFTISSVSASTSDDPNTRMWFKYVATPTPTSKIYVGDNVINKICLGSVDIDKVILNGTTLYEKV